MYNAYVIYSICSPIVMGVRHGENHDQQAEQIRVIVPRALIRYEYVPIGDRVHGTTGSIIETGEHAENACRRRFACERIMSTNSYVRVIKTKALTSFEDI